MEEYIENTAHFVDHCISQYGFNINIAISYIKVHYLLKKEIKFVFHNNGINYNILASALTRDEFLYYLNSNCGLDDVDDEIQSLDFHNRYENIDNQILMVELAISKGLIKRDYSILNILPEMVSYKDIQVYPKLLENNYLKTKYENLLLYLPDDIVKEYF